MSHSYGLITLNLKLPTGLDRKSVKRNLTISLANKFNSPEELERYVKSKKRCPTDTAAAKSTG